MRNKTITGRPTVHNDKNGVGLILSRDGYLISFTMDERNARELAREIIKAADEMPRVATEADLGIAA